jgi:hypothetical protein
MGVAAFMLPILSGIAFACAVVMSWQGFRIIPASDERHRQQGAMACGAFLLLWMACASLALSEIADAVGRIEAGQACPAPRKHPRGHAYGAVPGFI